MTKKNPKKQNPNQIHSSIALPHNSAEPHQRCDHSLVEGGENFNEQSANSKIVTSQTLTANLKNSCTEFNQNTFKRNSKSSFREPNESNAHFLRKGAEIPNHEY